jgi:hypothetical protein
LLPLDAIRQQAVMPDAQEVVWKHVLQETVEEFLGRKDIRLQAVAIAAIPVVVMDLAALATQDAVVADGHPMRVASEVVQQSAWSGKRGLRVDHPTLLPPSSQATVSRGRVAQIGQLWGKVQLARHEQLREAVQVLRAEHLAEPAHGKEEFASAGDPPRAVFGQGPGSDQAMHMEVRT